MQCRWRSSSRSSIQSGGSQLGMNGAGLTGGTPVMRSVGPASPGPQVAPSDPSPFGPQGQQPVPQAFDYASFMWDGRDAWQQLIMDFNLDTTNVDENAMVSDQVVY